MDKSKINLTNTLMFALEYDDDDLEANRNGELSEWQSRRLHWNRDKQIGVFLMRVIGAILIVSWCMLSANVDFIANPHAVLIPIAMLGAGLLYARLPLSRGFLYHRDAKAGKIGVAEGHIRLDIMEKKQYAVYVGPERFDVSKEVFLAFKNNDPYRLYYVPYSNTLVAAEWLYDGGFFDEESTDENTNEDDSNLARLMSSQE